MGEARRRKFMVAGTPEAQAEIAKVADMKAPQPVFEVKVQVFDGLTQPVIAHPPFTKGQERMGATAIVDMLLEAAQVMIREHLIKEPSRIVRV
jgi:hypothetical protein